jgi:hypothetical protein
MNRTNAVASGPGCHLPPSHVLPFLRCVDTEHADALTTKLHGIAIGDREAMRGACAFFNIGLSERWHGRSKQHDDHC